jgi:sugar phosphate isomerase/epimerase
MKTCFSTLGCPDWSVRKSLDEAKRLGFDGVELRFVNGSDALWELPELTSGVAETKRAARDLGVEFAQVGVRAHFHFADPAKRREQIDEAKKNIDIAGNLGSPGARLWGDKVQPGADRESTMKWISEAIWTLAEYGRPMKVGMRLETHGDFTSSADNLKILRDCGCHGAGLTWDPANILAGCGEKPSASAAAIGPYIEHVHFKDEKLFGGGKRDITLLGKGDIPLAEIVASLKKLKYAGYVSLEWEKRNFPNAPGPEVAFPDFISWWKAHSA